MSPARKLFFAIVILEMISLTVACASGWLNRPENIIKCFAERPNG